MFNRIMRFLFVGITLILFQSNTLFAQSLDSLQSFDAPAANQAVAVDGQYFYAIDNKTIEKYDKESGSLVKKWEDTTGAIKHLNSGVVIKHKLYCAHSNFPEIPMASSIEVFDTEDLRPIDNHSFGIDIGSATWIDWYDGYWYVAFAHYNRFKDKIGKDNSWTQLVKYTNDWKRVGGWIFPEELYDEFGKMSNSGGVINGDGTLFLTGHDFKKLYKMKFPKNGYSLEWVDTFSAPFEGQGIATDPVKSEIIYGIQRSEEQVIKASFSKLKE